MSQRKIDSEIFRDKWFFKLSSDAKLLFIYLITNCDHAGIIEFNPELAAFETKIKGLAKGYETLMKELESRLITVTEDDLYIVGFVQFQVCKVLNPNVKYHNSVIKRQEEFGNPYLRVKKPLVKGTLKNKNINISNKHIDNSKEIVEGVQGEKEESQENIQEIKFPEFWKCYPKRKGKKVGKVNSLKMFKRIKEHELDRVIANAINYGIGNELPKDPERFLKDDFWKDWDKPSELSKPTFTTPNSSRVNSEQAKTHQQERTVPDMWKSALVENKD